jgi:hypothetical protein
MRPVSLPPSAPPVLPLTPTPTVSEKPLWQGLTFHHFGLILSATFGIIAVVVAFFLILRHATHYLKPYEQTYIIRILVMIPIYAVVSFLSYLYYKKAVYFEVLRDCYEAFAISSFFTLMCHYIAPNLHEQKAYFRNVEPKNWVWPVTWMQKCTGGEDKGWLRRPRSGLTWFNVVWISIFQYCLIRPAFTIVAVVTQTQGRYCASSKDPRYAYIWVAGFEAASVTVAMYCLIQFYIQLKDDLAPHRPFLKVLCIKLVIFFCFWQSWIISLLTAEGGPLKATEQIAGPDLRIGIPSMLTCVEMAIFSLLHIWAFPWKPYDLNRQNPLDTAMDGYSSQPKSYAHGPIRAILDALNPWDILKACSRGFRWLFVGVRHREKDSSYQTKLEPVSPDTAYRGPTFAGDGSAAVTTIARPLATKQEGSGDSDTTGLLSNAQANPYISQAQSSYHGSSAFGSTAHAANPDALPQAPTSNQQYNLAPRTPSAPSPGVAPYPAGDSYFGNGNNGYHSNSAAAAPHSNAGWDMFAGATGGQPGAGRNGSAGPNASRNGSGNPSGWI